MRAVTINSRRWLSSTKKMFVEVQSPLADADPVELLFTRYLDKQKLDSAIPSFDQVERTPEYKLPRSFYTQLIERNPTGTITNHSYKGLSITMVPLNYLRSAPIDKLYKLPQKQSPDLLMMQLRPDRLLSDFQLIRKKGDTFSDSLYWQQICRKGYDSMPSGQLRQRVATTLMRASIRLKPLTREQRQQHELACYRKVRPFRSTETINNDVVATASFYSEWNGVPVLMCDLPQASERQHLANSLTLMELQLLFRQTCEQLAMYPPSATPKQLAQFLFPEVLLHYSERYMATLLEYIAAVGKHKKIVMLAGLLQAEAVLLYLKNRSVSSILADLLPPKPQGSIMRDISGHEVVEKHCLLDVLQYGSTLPQTPLTDLQTTSNMLKYYLGGLSQQSVHFRQEMYMWYLDIFKQSLAAGQRLKQQQFIRNVL